MNITSSKILAVIRVQKSDVLFVENLDTMLEIAGTTSQKKRSMQFMQMMI